MTVESSTTSVELEGNGSAREFSFSPIKIFDATQLEVVLRDTDGSLTTLTRGTGSAAYSVQATFTENEASTGSVRYPDSGGTLLTAGQFLSIRRVVPFKQETNFENQGGYLPEVQESTHDLHTMRALQLQEELSRTVKVPFGSDVAAEDYLSTVEASATAAATSASAASTSATNAATSASAASTSATNAASSATAAASSATAAETAKDDAETAVASIGSSVSDAAASASAASTSATNAATSASAASTSATNAATSASAASSSASSAASAQTAAEAARDATLTAYDNFDDRYLGAKSSDPTLDNDGNALVAGSLYFNTVDGAMKIYTGSVWVAAYVSGTDFLAKANNLSDLTSASTARTNLGLGTMATQNASAVAITGGSVSLPAGGLEVVGGSGTSGYIRLYEDPTNGTNYTDLKASAGFSSNRTLTLPGVTDTIVGRTTPDTLTNKTIAAGSNTITGLGVSNLGGITGTASSTTYLRGDGTWAAASGGETAKAWVSMYYSGGTPTARDSFNVSSLTDNGTGDVTVNFTSAFSNSNFLTVGCAGQATNAYAICAPQAQTTSSVRVYWTQWNNVATDWTLYGGVACFGDS